MRRGPNPFRRHTAGGSPLGCAGAALTALALGGCAGTPADPGPPAPPAGGLPACRALVAAAPADWPTHWRAVHDRGDAVVPQLIRALRDQPDGPGAQAAVHLLGELRGTAARTFLEDVLDDGTTLGAEAALALGKLGATESVAALRGVVDSPIDPITTRVAAAAGLVRMGHGRSVSDFLTAVFLAASPYGAATTRRHGIPAQKTRWAHERYMVIEALRARYDGRTFGLDEDSSWPAMRDAAATMAEFLATTTGPK